MHCVVAAGGIPGPDHVLYPFTQGKLKSAMDMGGRLMLERVVDALQASAQVECVIVSGINEGYRADFNFKQPVQWLPDHGNMVQNFNAGLVKIAQDYPETQSVLLCSSDIPHLIPQAVDHFIEVCQPYDHLFYYSYVQAELVKERYPNADRAFESWSNGDIFAGDIFIVNRRILETGVDLWEAWDNSEWERYPKIKADMLERVGADAWQKLSGRDISYEEEVNILSAFLGDDKVIKIIFSPYAELALDADYPSDIPVLRAEFETPNK